MFLTLLLAATVIQDSTLVYSGRAKAFSYRPVPGTLVYLGYGSTMEEPREFRFQDVRRTKDGFVGKISYLFRL
jgi:hypothetical protein